MNSRWLRSFPLVLLAIAMLAATSCATSQTPQTTATPTSTPTTASMLIPHVEEFPIYTNLYNQTAPEVSGDIVVWHDFRNGNYDIYGYNLSSNTEFPICTNLSNQGGSAISGDIVVWPDYRNSQSDIYGARLSFED